MPRDPKLVAFAATTDAARATAFYTTVLGLTLRHEDEFASRSRPSNDRQTGRKRRSSHQLAPKSASDLRLLASA